jgi:hypothetical protein
MAILRGRHIAGQFPYRDRPGNPFFYHGGIAHPDSIVPDIDSQDSGVNSPYLGSPAHGGEFTPAFPDLGLERNALPQALPNPPSVHFDRPLLQPISARAPRRRALPPFAAEGMNYRMPGGTPNLGQDYKIPSNEEIAANKRFEKLNKGLPDVVRKDIEPYQFGNIPERERGDYISGRPDYPEAPEGESHSYGPPTDPWDQNAPDRLDITPEWGNEFTPAPGEPGRNTGEQNWIPDPDRSFELPNAGRLPVTAPELHIHTRAHVI